ncbi:MULTISPECIES: ATP-binding protein [unclassified Streptomyces]|uniref:ATP-binding protein n=1 Tax=unclassified Streptomyces TaxID=2593676 RepID=UPI001F100D0B|nr:MULTISPECIES: ATP-binding protein [unclassified Streptomyces]
MNQTTPQLLPPVRMFSQQISPTRRGARLARLLTLTELHFWGAPQDITERAEQVVAELAANAVLHGAVPGRDFRLGLALDTAAGTLRIEVTDARGDRLPVVTGEGEGGRGLPLVAALTEGCWGVVPYPPSGKTVWAVLAPPETRKSDVVSTDPAVTACQTGLTTSHRCANTDDLAMP